MNVKTIGRRCVYELILYERWQGGEASIQLGMAPLWGVCQSVTVAGVSDDKASAPPECVSGVQGCSLKD